MLHRRRKRLEELAKQEAEGAVFWSARFGESVRAKVVHAFMDAAGEYDKHEAAAHARNAILRDEGLHYLHAAGKQPYEDLLLFLLNCDDETVPTVIEALVVGLGALQYSAHQAVTMFVATVQTVLREHRISFELVNGEMVEFSSQELHESVVMPTLRLLHSNSRFVSVERAYRDALDEISQGKPADAITDAGTALQETLVALGCSGNALGPLIASARSKNLLAPHDNPMVGAMEKCLHWVSADRSTSGDAHAATQPTHDDAWLIVHVVGALILRLTANVPRGS